VALDRAAEEVPRPCNDAVAGRQQTQHAEELQSRVEKVGSGLEKYGTADSVYGRVLFDLGERPGFAGEQGDV
jgi:hypothetical protein